MKRLQLFTAVTAILLTGEAFAATYTTWGNAGAVNVDAGVTPDISYTSPNASPAISGDWDFAFNGTTVDFDGTLYLGDYSTYTTATFFFSSMDGTITYEGAEHALSGTAAWDAGTNTLTYSYLGASNDGSGSIYSETNSSCTGSGNISGNTVCGSFASSTPNWEGLDLNLVFSSDLSSFTGSLQGISTSGSGLTANTTTLNYAIAGAVVAEVPVPAAAWLFGSALIGLAGVKRRKS